MVTRAIWNSRCQTEAPHPPDNILDDARSDCDADRSLNHYAEMFDLSGAFFRVTRAIGTRATIAAIATARSEPASPGLFDMM